MCLDNTTSGCRDVPLCPCRARLPLWLWCRRLPGRACCHRLVVFLPQRDVPVVRLALVLSAQVIPPITLQPGFVPLGIRLERLARRVWLPRVCPIVVLPRSVARLAHPVVGLGCRVLATNPRGTTTGWAGVFHGSTFGAAARIARYCASALVHVDHNTSTIASVGTTGTIAYPSGNAACAILNLCSDRIRRYSYPQVHGVSQHISQSLNDISHLPCNHRPHCALAFVDQPSLLSLLRNGGVDEF